MPLLTSALLLSSTWLMASPCPAPLSYLRTTVGAITNSSALSVCVSSARFVEGTNGSMNLVIGSSASPSPRCLNYPNGLSPDLAFSLLDNGHVGCWSLYPPGQVVTIVNLSTPSQTSIQAALRNFKPDVPRIGVKPRAVSLIGTSLTFSLTASVKQIKATLLNLPLLVRFKPASYFWRLSPNNKTYSSAAPIWKSDIAGSYQMENKVSFGVEYSFVGLTPWRTVKPNITVSAVPMSLTVKSLRIPPEEPKQIPRLVGGPCANDKDLWGC